MESEKDDIAANQWFKRASSLGVIEASSMLKRSQCENQKSK